MAPVLLVFGALQGYPGCGETELGGSWGQGNGRVYIETREPRLERAK